MSRRFATLAACLIASLGRTAPLSMVVLNTQSSQGGRLPDGWQVKVTRGTPVIQVVKEGNRTSLRLRSQSASFALERGVDVDVVQLPFLTWSWKVTEIPAGGDFRNSSTDDQAAQVLIAFSDRRILSYIWDSSAPKGTFQSASSIPLVHIWAMVCRSGPAEKGQWVTESRNVAADYQRAYGRPPAHVKGVRIQINSQHTASTAESQFGEVAFRAAP